MAPLKAPGPVRLLSLPLLPPTLIFTTVIFRKRVKTTKKLRKNDKNLRHSRF